MTTPAPTAMPLKKPIIKKIRLLEELTDASASLPREVADDQRVGGVVQLLEQVPEEEGDREGNQMFFNRPFCH